MCKKPSGKLNQLTVEGAVNALHNYEYIKEVMDNDFNELVEILKEHNVPHAETKLEDIIYHCMYLGFAKGMRFQHCAEYFINPDNEHL
ncbi:MAG: hypothetical protein IKU44_05030 [Firmicutes bacterium]|nr:hypothetical protein [Bacillota bacterium]